MFDTRFLFNVVEVIFCTSITSLSENNHYIFNYSKCGYCILMLIATITIQSFGLSYVSDFISSVFKLSLGDVIFFVGYLSQGFQVVLGLCLTLSSSTNFVKYSDKLQSNLIYFKDPLNCWAIKLLNKVLVFFTIFIVGLYVHDVVTSFKFFLQIRFESVLLVHSTFYLCESYCLYTKIYWTKILIVFQESLESIKINLYNQVSKANFSSKSEKISNISSAFEATFVLLDMIDTFSLQYTPQFMVYCAKYVINSAPYICHVLDSTVWKLNPSRPYFLLTWHAFNLSELSWVVYAYVSIPQEVSFSVKFIIGI